MRRLPGTAVFLASTPNGVPLALTQFVKHNHVLHERVVLVTVLIEELPHIPDEDRAEVIEIDPGHHAGDPALRLHAVSDDL